MSSSLRPAATGAAPDMVPSTTTHRLPCTTSTTNTRAASPHKMSAWHHASLRLCCNHVTMTTKQRRGALNSLTAHRTSRPSPATTTTAQVSEATTPHTTTTTNAHSVDGDAPLLTDVSALFVGGRVSGVVNCCGTDSAYDLLSALAGWELPADVTFVEGDVVLNGTPVTAPSYQARSVFLDDDLAPLENLSVRENLSYARSLRIAMTSQAYTVEEVLEELALTSVKDVVLRDCGPYVRRRVMLGKELLLNPMVLLLDHPLRGLATHEARQFLSLLRRLAAPPSARAPLSVPPGTHVSSTTHTHVPSSVAESTHTNASATATPRQPPSGHAGPNRDLPSPVRQARVVVLSMVQPRWVLMQLLDDITLLVRDKVLYCGPLEGLFRAPLLDPRQLNMTRANAHAAASLVPDLVTTATAAATDKTVLSVTAEAKRVPAVTSTDTPRQTASVDFSTTLVARERRRELFLQQVYQAASSGPLLGLETPLLLSATDAADGDAEPSQATMDNLLAAMASTGNAAAVRGEVDSFLRECAAGTQTLEGWRHVPPSGAQQFMFLCFYELVQLRHGLIWRGVTLLLVSLLCVLLAWLYSKQSGQNGMQTRVGILFFLVSSTFLNTLMSTSAVRRECTRFQRHRAQGYYSTLTYVSYRYVADVVVRFIVGTFIALLVFLCTNFGGTWNDASVFELMVVLVLTSICGSMTALLTCSACALLPAVLVTVDQFVLLAVYTGNLLFAGLVLNLTSMPTVVQGVSLASVCRLAFESCVLTQFHGRTFGCVRPDDSSNSSSSSLGSSSSASSASSSSFSVDDVEETNVLWRSASDALATAAASLPRSWPARAAYAWSTVDTSSSFSDSASGNSSEIVIPCHTGDSFAAFLGFATDRRWLNVLGLAVLSLVLFACCLISMGTARSHRHIKRTVS